MGTGKTLALFQASDKAGEPLVVKARIVDEYTGSVHTDKWAPALYSAHANGQQIICELFDDAQNNLGMLHLIAAIARDTDGDGSIDYYQMDFSSVDGNRTKQVSIFATGANNSNTTVHEAKYTSQPLVLPETFAWNAITGKPFYVAPGLGKMVLPETAYDASDTEEEIVQFPILTPIQLEKGREYAVTINGTDFVSECMEILDGDAPMYIIGNTPILLNQESNGQPFVIVSMQSGQDAGDGTMVYGMFLYIRLNPAYDSGTFCIHQAANDPVMLNAASLPAMTASTKGGAIAGEGLVMDGDVLKVDMELVIAQVKASLNS